MRPETETLEGLGDSLAKAMRCNARVAFFIYLRLSDRKNTESVRSPLAGNPERIDTIMSKADGAMTKADTIMSGLDRPAGGKHGGVLLQAVTSIRELAENFDKRSGTLMADGRRTLGDISQAVNNLDKNPTRLLFGASSNGAAAPAPALPREKRLGSNRQ
jgi:phospholipid/cholesterol/gamma-HCH transport system substrate-binding protein